MLTMNLFRITCNSDHHINLFVKETTHTALLSSRGDEVWKQTICSSTHVGSICPLRENVCEVCPYYADGYRVDLPPDDYLLDIQIQNWIYSLHLTRYAMRKHDNRRIRFFDDSSALAFPCLRPL